MNLTLSIFLILCSALLTKVFCFMAQGTRLMDKPNARSSHTVPTVRGGGLVFIGIPLLILPILCYVKQTPINDLFVLILSVIALATVSFLDDLYQLSAKSRLIIQAIVALLIAFYMRPEQLDFGLFVLSNTAIVIPFLFVAVLWSINHFNFMDGLDGICALQAVFLFLAYAVLFGIAQAPLYHDFCFILIFSLLGFLLFNFPPAQLFMGDVGSATLGLLVFCIAIIAQQKYQIPVLYWFMLNGLFLFDATVTLIRRIKNKEKWSTPHRKHAYQRLKQLGLNTRWILLGQAISNVCLLVLVLMVQSGSLKVLPALLIELSILCLLYYSIEQKLPMHNRVST